MIQIHIPDYLRELQVSKTRRPKYYKNPKKLPKQYQDETRYVFKEGKLYDKEKKLFPCANINLLEKPRYVRINGNDIMRMHSRVWGKIVKALHEMFSEAIKAQVTREEALKIAFPWKVSLEFRTQHGYADWDIDNPWIYEKCFHDALKKAMGFDDSILKITNGGEKKFRPVRSFETRSIVATITTDTEFRWPETDKIISIDEGSEEPGKLDYDYHGSHATIHTGRRKVIYGKAKDAITALMFKCLNDMVPVCMTRDLYNKYESFFNEFKKYNVKIIIKA